MLKMRKIENFPKSNLGNGQVELNKERDKNSEKKRISKGRFERHETYLKIPPVENLYLYPVEIFFFCGAGISFSIGVWRNCL